MGQTSDRFFVSFDTGALEAGEELNFMITPGTGLGSTFSITVPLVPGPGSLAALIGAFVVISVKRRRRS